MHIHFSMNVLHGGGTDFHGIQGLQVDVCILNGQYLRLQVESSTPRVLPLTLIHLLPL